MLRKIIFVLRLIGWSVSLVFQRLGQALQARIHRATYTPVAAPKNVVVIGASFAGWMLAKHLAESLPTGYRVILIEKHSHFHFTWNFPRITVVSGHDHKAFIPYAKRIPSAPQGVYRFQQGNVVSINLSKVTLEDGSSVEYEYLVLATGSRARYPATLDSDDKASCMAFFEMRRRQVHAATNVVVVGGGAAGVEVAGDIKSKYPDKNVTLIHSRAHLLNNFGPRLHDVAQKALEHLGVTLYLSDRVVSGLDAEDPKQVTLKDGTVVECDLVIRCTGQTPNTALAQPFSPASISPAGGLLVDNTLQLKDCPSPNFFAAGDVVAGPGPKLGRGASLQGMFVARNILRAINGQPLKTYSPSVVDTSIELTLGLVNLTLVPVKLSTSADPRCQGKNVTYLNDGNLEMSFGRKMPDEAMHAAQMWKIMGMKPFHDQEADTAKL